MAYETRLRPMLIACMSMSAIVWSGLVAASDAIFSVLRWHEYVPDVRQRLDLDRLGHAVSIEPQQAIRRSLSYRARALLHQLFTGCGFAEPTAVGSA